MSQDSFCGGDTMTEELRLRIANSGTELIFPDWDSTRKWLEKERALWDWLRPGDGITDTTGISTHVSQTFDSAFNGLSNLQNSGQSLSQGIDALRVLTPGVAIFASESEEGTQILDIRSSHGDEAAAFAYAFLKRRVSFGNASTPKHVIGALLTTIPDISPSTVTYDKLKNERANYKAASRSLIERMERAERERAKQSADTIKKARRIAVMAFKNRGRFLESRRDEWELGAHAAVTSIKGTENYFREFMKLRAPVEYWTTKSGKHLDNERAARYNLKLFFLFSGIVLPSAFIVSGKIVWENAIVRNIDVPSAIYILIAGGLAAISTIIFWVGRLLTKLYLSEHHLRNDAEERAVMTTTYLALTAEGEASEADRQIILNALFRSTPDGIIKEDGPADLSAQALLARFLAKPSTA